MPKRSVEEKLERYNKKIRKLQESIERRQNTRVISSEDEFQDPIIEDQILPPDELEVQQNSGIECQPQASAQFWPEEQQEVTEPPTEIEVDTDLLLALGATTSEAPEFGDKIHESLSNLWTPLLKKGMSTEDKQKLSKEYPVPDNCRLLQAPKLNAEISVAITDMGRARDKKIHKLQQQLGCGITAINRALDCLMQKQADNKVQAVKHLSDSCRLLSDLHHFMTKDRAKLILPNLEKKIQHIIQDTERDDTLFGNALSEKIKASKAIERQGLQIKKPTTKPTTSTSARPTNQGNWTGPPRYPSNRGGRGGLRKPNIPAPQRQYPTSSQSKAANHSYRSRARP